jgi:hypothetical protein
MNEKKNDKIKKECRKCQPMYVLIPILAKTPQYKMSNPIIDQYTVNLTSIAKK